MITPRRSIPPGAMRLTRPTLIRFFIFFGIRHLFGVAIFLFIAVTAFQASLPIIGYLMLALTPAYATFAFISARKLWQQFQKMNQARDSGNKKDASR